MGARNPKNWKGFSTARPNRPPRPNLFRAWPTELRTEPVPGAMRVRGLRLGGPNQGRTGASFVDISVQAGSSFRLSPRCSPVPSDVVYVHPKVRLWLMTNHSGYTGLVLSGGQLLRFPLAAIRLRRHSPTYRRFPSMKISFSSRQALPTNRLQPLFPGAPIVRGTTELADDDNIGASGALPENPTRQATSRRRRGTDLTRRDRPVHHFSSLRHLYLSYERQLLQLSGYQVRNCRRSAINYANRLHPGVR